MTRQGARGVPSSRLNKLKELALSVLAKRMRKTAPNGGKPAASTPGASFCMM
jgi:hypothetical protein